MTVDNFLSSLVNYYDIDVTLYKLASDEPLLIKTYLDSDIRSIEIIRKDEIEITI